MTLTALGIMFVSSAAMPAIGLGVEQRLPWRILGKLGELLVAELRGLSALLGHQPARKEGVA